MDKIVNTVKYREIERVWYTSLNEGKKVEVKIDIIYEEVNKRPTGFNVTYWVDDNPKVTSFLPNGE